jgi:N-acetyl-anhydromuramyl-L-alanine amidase AmpD
MNYKSVGICCVGHGDRRSFTEEQTRTLVILLLYLCRTLGLNADAVLGHREAQALLGRVNKTCPGTQINMDQLRGMVRRVLEEELRDGAS